MDMVTNIFMLIVFLTGFLTLLLLATLAVALFNIKGRKKHGQNV